MTNLPMLLSAADTTGLFDAQQHCARELAARLLDAEKRLRQVESENRELKRLLAASEARRIRDGN